MSTILLLPMANPNGRLDHGAKLGVIDRVQRCVSMRKETDQHRAHSMRSDIAILIGSPEGPGPRHRDMGCPAIPQGNWSRHATSLKCLRLINTASAYSWRRGGAWPPVDIGHFLEMHGVRFWLSAIRARPSGLGSAP